MLTDQFDQLAPGVIEQLLQLTAHVARDHRCRPAAGNGDLQRAAFDHGRHMEGGKLRVVDHIHEQTADFGRFGDGAVGGGVVGGGDHQPDIVGQPLRIKPALQPLHALRLDELGKCGREFGRADPGQGTGVQQGQHLALGHRATANHQHSPAFEGGKQGEQGGVQGGGRTQEEGR
ncbi:hypothetical protein D3C71_1199340 [compost metagenome]